MTGIETLAFLSGSATQFGPPAPDFDYDVTLHDDNVAAGKTLSVNGNELTAGESMVFDGSNEMDGNFILRAGQGNDTLIGGAGADTLYGNGGADDLTGGDGNDVFLYRSVNESKTGSIDEILDFTSGDRIDLSTIDANSLIGGNQAFTLINDAVFSGAAGELRLVVTGNQWLIEGDTDGNGSADFILHVTAADSHLPAPGDFNF